jgi:hypothetical protein
MAWDPDIGLSREAWGPRFWKILHTLAECSGEQTTQIQMNDEADAWHTLLRAQAHVMPCTLCKDHYLEWHRTHKTDGLRTMQCEERKAWLRKWLWGCHNRVNLTNQKISPELDSLPFLYTRVPIEKEMKELSSMFQLALMKQSLKPEDVTRWKQTIARLRLMAHI